MDSGDTGRLTLSLRPLEAVRITAPEGAVRLEFRHKSGRCMLVNLDDPKGWRIDRTPPPPTPPTNPGGRAA